MIKMLSYDLTRIVVIHFWDEHLLRWYDCVLTFKNGSITEFRNIAAKKDYFYSLSTIFQ